MADSPNMLDFAAGLGEARAGTTTFSASATTKAITFSRPMPNTNYAVFLQLESNVALVHWVTNKTVTGFTINLTLGLNPVMGWIAVLNG